MTSPQRRFPVYFLSSAVASVVVVERESALAVDAVVQAGAVGASLVPGDVVGKAAAEVNPHNGNIVSQRLCWNYQKTRDLHIR